MFNKVTISSDDILNTFRQLAQNPEQFENIEVIIGDIQALEVKIFGEKFHKSLTPTIMKGIIALQEGVYRSYCYAQYGDTNLQQLSKEERSQLEFTVIINEGCTDFLALIKEVFEAAAGLMTNMTGKEKLLAIGFMLLTFLGYTVITEARSYMSERDAYSYELQQLESNNATNLATQENMLRAFEAGSNGSDGEESPITNNESGVSKTHTSIENTQDEEGIEGNNIGLSSISPEDKDDYIKVLKPISSDDIEVIEQIKAEYIIAQKTASIMDDSINSFIKSTAQADKVRYNNVAEMSGSVAAEIASQPRRTSESIVLKQKFRVLNVDSNKTQFIQARLRPLNGSYPDFNAIFTDNAISKPKQTKLTNALIGYNPIYLSIEGKVLGGKISNAMIAQVGDVDPSINFKQASEVNA